MEKPSARLLKLIEKEYKLSSLKFVRKVSIGYLSHNFIVRDKKATYFLKQHRHQNPNRIDEIFAIEDFFSKKGIPVIQAFKNQTGKKYFLYQSNYYSLLPFIKGKMYKIETVTPKALRSAAKLSAKMHKLSMDEKPKLTKDHHKTWSKKIFTDQVTLIEAELHKYKKTNTVVKSCMDLLDLKKSLVAQDKVKISQLHLDKPILLHDDFHLTNLFFNKKDEVEWIFDFEKSTMGSRYYELIRSLDLICFGTKDNVHSWKKAKIYLKTYHQFNPISPQVFKDELTNFYLKNLYGVWLLKEFFLHHNKRIVPLIPKELKRIPFYLQNAAKFDKMITDIIQGK